MKSLFGKIGVFLGILGAGCVVATVNVKVNAAEETEPEITETTNIEYPCKVVEDLTAGGDVLFDIIEGNVGDVVTAYVKSDFLYSTKSVIINGTEVELSEDGKYQFTLIEGNNTFNVVFEANSERIKEFADLINGVKKNGFSSLFTVENLIIVIYGAISIIFSSGFFLTLIKNKKLKSKTVAEVQDTVVDTIQTEENKILTKFLNSVIDETLQTINLKMDNVDECIKTLCRCFVLAQNDTPENKLAIIEELTKLPNNEEALSNKIRSLIKEEQATQEAKVAARDKAIEELKENNKKLNTEEEADNYGQL